MLNEKDRDELRGRLLTEQRELLELGISGNSSSATVELDQTRTGRLTRMDALQAQEMAKAGNARVRQRLTLIEAALRRFENNEFGTCRNCGESIPAGRLKADPCALFCVNCASERGD